MAVVGRGAHAGPAAHPAAGRSAAYIVKSLPIRWLRWLVLLVVLYAAAMMLRSALPSTGRTTLQPEG
ncbi:MAG TPA: hypothetical protein VMG33_09145 [Steroidobacteraceae bacterium]|nr:hypothetical protein [Steroidobacteraceae bacterium]